MILPKQTDFSVWVAAGDLVEGDEVYLIDGSTAFVTGAELEKLEEPIKVYNLEVADFTPTSSVMKLFLCIITMPIVWRELFSAQAFVQYIQLIQAAQFLLSGFFLRYAV